MTQADKQNAMGLESAEGNTQEWIKSKKKWSGASRAFMTHFHSNYDSTQGSRENDWQSCAGSALQKQPQKAARIWWNFCPSFKSEMLFQHSSYYKAHTHTHQL
jgi:hypothetical protein